MKTREIRELNDEELKNKSQSLREELFKLNYQRRAGRVERPHHFKRLRKEIAVIETILRERQR